MAVCHTLTTAADGELVGTQVDKASFKSTGATIEHKKGHSAQITLNGEKYTVLRQFEFDCKRAAQSVIVEDEHGEKHVFAKGSPESIRAMCAKSSVPSSFDASVRAASKTGLYQLAMGFRSFGQNLPISKVDRYVLVPSSLERCQLFLRMFLSSSEQGRS
jgi:magnesium-transporting ATPase (P-type)